MQLSNTALDFAQEAEDPASAGPSGPRPAHRPARRPGTPVAERHGTEEPLGPANPGRHGGQLVRRRGQAHLAQQRLDPGRLTGEADAEQAAYRAAATVAADQVTRPQLRPVGQLGGDPVLVLAQPDQLPATPELDPSAVACSVNSRSVTGCGIPRTYP